MTMQIVSRVTNNPTPAMAAMAAGAFGPAMVIRMMPQVATSLGPQILPAAIGAATYYLMDDVQDMTGMAIGAAAGYGGLMLRAQMGM